MSPASGVSSFYREFQLVLDNLKLKLCTRTVPMSLEEVTKSKSTGTKHFEVSVASMNSGWSPEEFEILNLRVSLNLAQSGFV